jgi:hypothetical protein
MRAILSLCTPLVLSAALIAGSGCGSDSKKTVSSRSYKGHENDADAANLVKVYPTVVGTRLDDCQTCHKGGTFTKGSSTTAFNVCDYCHLVAHPDRVSGYTGTVPASYADTLNTFGTAYKAAGRSQQALRDIASADSDSDTFGNGDEIAALRFPGDATSKPGQPFCPTKMFTLTQLQALATHSEFLLANSQKQQYDYYATYTGVKLKDLLTAAGVDPADSAITGLFVSAPDGFVTSVSTASINSKLPDGVFHAGLDTATLGTTCGFVQYPTTIPAGVTDGAAIPDEQWITLAWARDGAQLDTATYDNTSGKINGEGPYRLVVPQSTPGWPDRGSSYSPVTGCAGTYDYNSGADHNAGKMARGVVAIRVEPLNGCEGFDYVNGGWSMINDGTLVVYGHGVTQ